MKKLISVLLAVSALALSTSAFAAPTVTNRNTGATAFATAETGSLPCFRNGDSVTFSLTDLSGASLTLISSKVGATADNSTIQYINQYKPSGTAQEVSYKIRELQTNGTYNLLIKDGDKAVVSFYYNVANPSVALAKASADAENYIVADDKKGNIAFAAVASSNGAKFAESGVASVGFTFTDGTKNATSATLSAAELDTIGGEVGGNFNVVYGITVSGVTGGVEITPTAVMN